MLVCWPRGTALAVLAEWIELADVARLDIAYAGREREMWLELLRDSRFVVAGCPKYKVQRRADSSYLPWLISRHVRVKCVSLTCEALGAVSNTLFLRFPEATEVVLNRYSRVPINAKQLAFVLSRCPAARVLRVEHWSLVDNEMLLALGRAPSQLAELYLHSTNPGSAVVDEALFALMCHLNGTLRVLSLKGIEVSDNFLKLLSAQRLALTHLELEGSLSSSLLLQCCSFTKTLVSVSVDGIANTARAGYVEALFFACPELVRLSVAGGDLVLTGGVLEEVLRIRPRVEVLQINGGEYVCLGETCALIIPNPGDVTEVLDVISLPVASLSTQANAALLRTVAEKCQKTLQALWLDAGDGFDDECLHRLLAYCMRLTELHLSAGCCRTLTDAALKHIARCLPQLRELELDGGCEFTDDGLLTLLSRCRVLDALSLNGCGRLTNRTLAALSSQGSLKTSLALTGTRVTAEAIVDAIVGRGFFAKLIWIVDDDVRSAVTSALNKMGLYELQVKEYLN